MRKFPTCLTAIKRKETRLQIKESQWIFLSELKKRELLQRRNLFLVSFLGEGKYYGNDP